MRKKYKLIGTIGVLTFVLAGCGAVSQPQSSAPNPAVGVPSANTLPVSANASVEINGFVFVPSAITVKKGTQVTWKNNDTAGHTVTADKGVGPSSGLMNKGDTYEYTFTAVGVFNYICALHPSMRGSVTVTE